MTQIIPAILAKDEATYRTQLHKIEEAATAESNWVHIDLMDNIFVQNNSIDTETIERFPTNLNKEIHLMVKDYHTCIFKLQDFGVKRFVLHFEADDPTQTQGELQYLEDLGFESGLAINPETPIDDVEQFFKDIDVLLIMSIHPGFQGQQFIPDTLEKIKEAAKIRDEGKFDFKIEVDGGITIENAKSIMEAGADNLVVGSHIVLGDIGENEQKFMEVINAAKS